MSRILIIDDDAFVGPMILALLASESHDAVLVEDADVGIRELSSSRFDLLIVDILRANMDGLALLARLRGIGFTLPVIGTTGIKLSEPMRPSQEFLDLAIEAGATCCLRSPLDPRHLLEAVNSNLGLSSGDHIAQQRRELSTEILRKLEIVIFERATVPRELRHALSVLRQYVDELGRGNEGNPRSLDSLRQIIAGALRASEQASLVVDSRDEAAGRAHLASETIGPGNRAVDLPANRQRGDEPTSSSRERLTPREREVLALVTDGLSNKAGGFRVSISVRTFEAHRANAMGKLGARNAAELVRFGLEAAR